MAINTQSAVESDVVYVIYDSKKDSIQNLLWTISIHLLSTITSATTAIKHGNPCKFALLWNNYWQWIFINSIEFNDYTLMVDNTILDICANNSIK